jgi:hypothetical protein
MNRHYNDVQLVLGFNDDIGDDYYPSPISRRRPNWFQVKGFPSDLSDLFVEVYKAIDGDQHRLAALGIRALLDQLMIEKVGDLPSFEEKLDAFQQDGGYISLIQRDAMHNALELGSAVMHRGFKPNQKELTTALDILEGVCAAIFSHAPRASELEERIPPRVRKPKRE